MRRVSQDLSLPGDMDIGIRTEAALRLKPDRVPRGFVISGGLPRSVFRCALGWPQFHPARVTVRAGVVTSPAASPSRRQPWMRRRSGFSRARDPDLATSSPSSSRIGSGWPTMAARRSATHWDMACRRLMAAVGGHLGHVDLIDAGSELRSVAQPMCCANRRNSDSFRRALLTVSDTRKGCAYSDCTSTNGVNYGRQPYTFMCWQEGAQMAQQRAINRPRHRTQSTTRSAVEVRRRGGGQRPATYAAEALREQLRAICRPLCRPDRRESGPSAGIPAGGRRSRAHAAN